MRRLLVSAALAASAATPVLAADPAHPTVVELFQSQGCSSCPPADAVLNRLADRSDVLALSFAVTYWDQLGWKDIFGNPAFTARQWDYAHHGGRREVATPQMIVNGRTVINGGNGAEALRAIAATDRGASGPSIAATSRAATITGPRPAYPATVWLVRYDPRTIPVAIRAGENGGRTIPHRDIVRSLDRLGTFAGGRSTYRLPASRDAGWRSAVLVQEGAGGPISAAAKL